MSSKYRFEAALRTDERVRLMDEIVSGVQVIKMYAWEIPFAKLIAFARKMELKVVRKSSYIRAVHMAFILFTTRLALFCTMLSIAVFYGSDQITVAKVFMISSYFSVVAMTMTQRFVRAVTEVSESLVAIRRIQNFLHLDEKQIISLDQNKSGFIDKTEVIGISQSKRLLSLENFHHLVKTYSYLRLKKCQNLEIKQKQMYRFRLNMRQLVGNCQKK